jgi:hypothetical protein
VISPTQRPLHGSRQYPHESDFNDPGRFRNRNPTRQAAADPRLRPRGHRNRQQNKYTYIILGNDQLDALFLNVFIFMPLHVSSSKCSSSGGSNCINTSSGITSSGEWLSAVPVRVHQVGHYPESHQDARSTKRKITRTLLLYLSWMTYLCLLVDRRCGSF